MSVAGPFQLLRAPAAQASAPVLDGSQQAVVDHAGGPVLVLAGPGTGKTTTLVEAVVDRVERRGLRPDQVLVLTFSRRAAAELRARIASRLGRTTRGPAAWTFHAFCYALVRRYDDSPAEAGALRLLSGPEQFLHVRRLLRGDADEGPERWPAELRPILLTRGFAEEVRDLLLRAQERGLSPHGLAELAAARSRPDWHAAARFYQDYLDVLAFEHAIDYAGLVQRAGDLLTDPAVQATEQARYDAVFVDEYQDTDPAQERLLQLLAGAGANLSVFGDPDQSIYGFRGAEVSGLLEFADRFRGAGRRPAKVLTLGVSRRAGKELLGASRAIAERLPAPGLPVAALRKHRALEPAPDVPAAAQIVVATYSSAAQQAMGIADALRRAHLQDGVPWREMAVLVRSGRRTIPTLRRALVAAGVPVAVAGDEIPLADDPAVTPLLTVLRSAIAPERLDEARAEALLTTLGGADAIGLRRLRRALRVTERAVGGRRPSAHLLIELVRDGGELQLLPPDITRPVERVAEALATARAAIDRGDTVEQVLWAVWEPSVLRGRLERQARGDGSAAIAANRDLDAVVALFDTAARFVDQLPRAGAELFLDDLDAQEIPAGTLSEKPAPGESVRLLTAHRAKGLEWEVVAVAGVQDGQWPDLRRRGSLLGAELLRDPGLPLEAASSSLQLVEERRLFYVAATRARRRLIVTAVDSGDDAGDRPSRFLAELGLPVPVRPERAQRVLSLRSLVGELRRALAAEDSSPAIRAAAAATLARLAAPTQAGSALVPSAHPDSWWGIHPLTDPGRPLVGAGELVRVSPSAAEQFSDCPLQWFMERKAGVQTQAGERQTFGNLLHVIAELAATYPARATPDAMLAMLDEVWPQLDFEAPWYAERQYDVARRAIRRIADFQARTTRQLAGAEVGFETAVGDALLAGKVDRLEVDDEGRGVVVDYKTSSSKVGGNKIREHPQLALYQLAIEQGAFEAVQSSGGAELVQLRAGTARPGSRPARRGHPRRPGRGVPGPAEHRLRAVRRRAVLSSHVPRRAGAVVKRPITVDDVADLLDLQLTGQQRAAVGAALVPGVIVAGAGSGKTAVMAARVVYLVGSGHVQPDQVLGLTFTNKAAAELAARIRVALGLLRQTPWAPLTDIGDEPTVSTYNAYAGRLVADHGLRIGVEPSSRIITRAQQWQLATRAVRAHRGSIQHLQIQPRSVVSRVLELAAQLADHLVSPTEVRAADAELRSRIEALPDPDKCLAEVLDCLARRTELLPFVEAFQQLKRERDLIDFGDQVAYAAQVAEQRPEVGAIERGRFAVVLLDEYQDTGVAQRRMLQALYAGGHPVTAVGDPCQSIYGWRGASVGNLVHFPEHFARADGQLATVHYLTTNFRSGGRILTLANEVSASLRDAAAAVHVPELQPRDSAVGAGRVAAALLTDVDTEAAWVADGVVQALERGVALREVAVLVRKRSQFDPIRRELEARDVPVEIVGLGGLLDTPEVNDLVSVLELLDDPTGNAALVRLLTGPRWRIGPRDLAALGSRASQLARWPVSADAPADPLGDALRDADIADVGSLLDALDSPGDPARYSPAAYDRFGRLAAELRSLRQRASQPLTDLIQDVERTIGLDVELMSAPALAGQGREANVAAFLDEAARFVGPDRESDLAAFLAFLQSARDQEAGLDIGVPTPADTVKLLTVHAAKGLEWDVVFVPGLSAGRRSSIFPAPSTLTAWITTPDQLPYPLRGDRDDLPTWTELTKTGRQAFLEACRDRDEVEERRIAYVAFTRARSELHLSGYHWGSTQTHPFGPSRFLTEAAHCAAVAVAEWAPPPADGSANPFAGRLVEVPWPAPLDAAMLAAVTAGATDVRRRLAATPGSRSPEVRSAGAADSLLIERWEQEAAVLLAELSSRRGSGRSAVLPAEISVSTFVDLQRAPGQLAQRLGRPLPQRPAPAARRGTAFHAWVEARSGQRQLLGPDDLPGAADDSMGDGDLAALQAHFLRTDYANRVPVEVEVPFEMPLGGHLVRGRIDAVYADDDGGFDVIDYKTGKPPTGADATAAAIQLSCYRLAWSVLSGAPPDRVRAGFLYVADERVVRPAQLYDESELAALLTALPAAAPARTADSGPAQADGAGRPPR